MGSRHTPLNNSTSSRARSVQAYYPFYPPPAYPEGLERGGYSGFGTVPASFTDERQGADKGIVRAWWNRWGESTRYTYGGTYNPIFRMRATGQVESSQFQRVTNMPLVAQFNDWLYRAAKGYPRNLGLSEKVPTLPQIALGNEAYEMARRPRFTRNVFTRRNFTSAPSIPARPQNR